MSSAAAAGGVYRVIVGVEVERDVLLSLRQGIVRPAQKCAAWLLICWLTVAAVS